VSVEFDCYGPNGPTEISASAFGVGADQMASSGDTATCTITNDNATYSLDQMVSLGCSATDADSGVQKRRDHVPVHQRQGL